MDPKPGQIALNDDLKPPVPLGSPADIAALNDWTPAGKRQTSIAAFWELLTSGRRVTQGMRVYDAVALSLHNGLTADDVERALIMRPQSVTARLWDLGRAGLVYRAGDQRKIASGSMAYIYRVTVKSWPASGSITAPPATGSAKRTPATAGPAASVAVSELARRTEADLRTAIRPLELSALKSSPTVALVLQNIADIRFELGKHLS